MEIDTLRRQQKAAHACCAKLGKIASPVYTLGKKVYIQVMKKALSKWILVELSAGLILLALFILNII